jgi:hypothetical protein
LRQSCKNRVFPATDVFADVASSQIIASSSLASGLNGSKPCRLERKIDFCTEHYDPACGCVTWTTPDGRQERQCEFANNPCLAQVDIQRFLESKNITLDQVSQCILTNSTDPATCGAGSTHHDGKLVRACSSAEISHPGRMCTKEYRPICACLTFKTAYGEQKRFCQNQGNPCHGCAELAAFKESQKIQEYSEAVILDIADVAQCQWMSSKY